jgi:enoyl-CoA hydratase/carnithine racemase
MNDRVTITHLEDGIADVRMVRTDKMNALDTAQFQALADTIEELHGAKGLRCVVLSGEGRAFCAGLDLSSHVRQFLG